MSATPFRYLAPIEHYLRGTTAHAQRCALVDGDVRVTHAELYQNVMRLSSAIATRLRPNHAQQKIALCANNSVEHVTAYLAILNVGAVWIPINPINGARLNAELLERVKPDLFLCDEQNAEHFKDVEHCSPARLLFESKEALKSAGLFRAKESLMAIKFTGGSTGRSKGVMQSNLSVAANMHNMQALYAFSSAVVNLSCAPLTHGASHYVIPVLAAGGTLVLAHKQRPSALLDMMNAHKVTHTFMPPALISMILKECNRPIESLRHLTYSAAPMPPALIEETIATFGPVLSTLYGQSEAPMTITALDTVQMQDRALQKSVGRACALSEVKVLSAEGLYASEGEGEVCVSGPLLMRAYLDDEEQTRATLREGFLHTSDWGLLEGGVLTLKGRTSEVMISGGFNVYPAEIENVLLEHQDVFEAAVFSRPDDKWGDRIEVALVTSDDYREEEVRSFVKGALSSVKTPKVFHVLKALPKNPVGKVVRREVRAHIDNKRESES